MELCGLPGGGSTGDAARHQGSDARIARLLQSYAEVGIRVGFVDITGPLGVPCCKAYVVHPDGRISAGTGAHLNARRALISALTETPYPYPHGPASRPLPPAAVRVPLEALPDYDRGDARESEQGRRPSFVHASPFCHGGLFRMLDDRLAAEQRQRFAGEAGGTVARRHDGDAPRRAAHGAPLPVAVVVSGSMVRQRMVAPSMRLPSARAGRA